MSFSIIFVFGIVQLLISGLTNADPTDGFSPVPLSQSNFQVQKPYDVSQNERYSFINGVHRLWVYSTDKPHTTSSPTKPRTEIKIQSIIPYMISFNKMRGYEYSSGVWQFEGNGYIPSGTSGVCVMQIFGGSSSATTTMVRVYDGSLTYYRSPVLSPNIYNRWFRLNVIHDVGASRIKVYVDGALKYETNGRGGTSHYFKFGVYAQDGESNYMESRWTGIRLLKKN